MKTATRRGSDNSADVTQVAPQEREQQFTPIELADKETQEALILHDLLFVLAVRHAVLSDYSTLALYTPLTDAWMLA